MTNEREAPQDKMLPHLRLALDMAYMQEVFNREQFGAGQLQAKLQVRECQITQLKYRPNKNCLICYRLRIEGFPTGEDEEQGLCAKVFPRGEGLVRLARAKARPLAVPRFGRPVFFIPDVEMVVWAFPNDPKLSGLPHIADTGKDGVIPELVSATFGPEWELQKVDHDIIRYNAEHACTARVKLRLRHARTGKKQFPVMYAKTYYNDDGAETYQNMSALRASDGMKNGQFPIAKPLSYRAKHKTLWTLGIRGHTFLDEDIEGSTFIARLEPAAATLSALHQSSVPCAGAITMANTLSNLRKAAKVIARVKPSPSACFEAIVDNLVLQAYSFGPRPSATLHHDLHLQNFHTHYGKIALLDLDNLAKGDPLYDIGRFLASIHFLGLLRTLSDQYIRHICEVFVCAYEKHVPWNVPRPLLDWYVVTMLIIKNALRCVTRLQLTTLTQLLPVIESLIYSVHQERCT